MDHGPSHLHMRQNTSQSVMISQLTNRDARRVQKNKKSWNVKRDLHEDQDFLDIIKDYDLFIKLVLVKPII